MSVWPDMVPRQTPPHIQLIKGGWSCCSTCTDGLARAARCSTSADLERIRDATELDLVWGGLPGCPLDVEDELGWRRTVHRYHRGDPPRPGPLVRLWRSLTSRRQTR